MSPMNVKNVKWTKIPDYMKLGGQAAALVSAENASENKENRPPTTKLHCKLCHKNGEPFEVFASHSVKSKDGKITCPVLRNHSCEICGATGDVAHTKSHCPYFGLQGDKPRPAFRILSNGKVTRYIHHK